MNFWRKLLYAIAREPLPPTPEQRAELRERLYDEIPKGMIIGSNDEELLDFPWNFGKWAEALGHEVARDGTCTVCHPVARCVLDAFHEATVVSVIRELDRIGALKEPRQARS